MRAFLLCLPLLLSACGDSSPKPSAVLTTPAAPAAPQPPVVAATPKSACEKAFEDLHRKPAALSTAGVVESVQPATNSRC